MTTLLTYDLLAGFAVPGDQGIREVAHAAGTLDGVPGVIGSAGLQGTEQLFGEPAVSHYLRDTQGLQGKTDSAPKAHYPALWRAQTVVADTPDPVAKRLDEQSASFEHRLATYLRHNYLLRRGIPNATVEGQDVICQLIRSKTGPHQLRLTVQTPDQLDLEDLASLLNWIKSVGRHYQTAKKVLSQLAINRSHVVLFNHLPQVFVDALERFASEYQIALELLKTQAYEMLPDKTHANQSEYEALIAPFVYALGKAGDRLDLMADLVKGSNQYDSEVGQRILESIHNNSNFITGFRGMAEYWQDQLETDGFVDELTVLSGEKSIRNLVYGSIIIAQRAHSSSRVGFVPRVSSRVITANLGEHFGELQNVLVNLISNSIKYGGRLVKIEISYDQDWNLLVAVRDNGIGMNQEQIEKAVTMGWRANDSIKGQGIGLYSAKKKVEELGGSFAIESEPRVGTAVRIFLPKEIV